LWLFCNSQKRGAHKFEIKEKSVATPVVEYWECRNCGEAFFDREANKKIDAVLLHDKATKRVGKLPPA
jgi:YgiT-type zinc finger domain-containing protein